MKTNHMKNGMIAYLKRNYFVNSVVPCYGGVRVTITGGEFTDTGIENMASRFLLTTYKEDGYGIVLVDSNDHKEETMYAFFATPTTVVIYDEYR